MGSWSRWVFVLGVAVWGACAPKSSQPPAQPSTDAGDAVAPPVDSFQPKSKPGERPFEEPTDAPDGGDPVDAAEAGLQRAELDLDQAFGDKSGSVAGAEQLSTGRCGRLCRSIDSMARAVDALCELTGDDDDRCEAAKRRLESGRRRVSDAGCGCSPG